MHSIPITELRIVANLICSVDLIEVPSFANFQISSARGSDILLHQWCCRIMYICTEAHTLVNTSSTYPVPHKPSYALRCSTSPTQCPLPSPTSADVYDISRLPYVSVGQACPRGALQRTIPDSFCGIQLSPIGNCLRTQVFVHHHFRNTVQILGIELVGCD